MPTLSKCEEFQIITAILTLVAIINNGVAKVTIEPPPNETNVDDIDHYGRHRYQTNLSGEKFSAPRAFRAVARLLVQDHEVVACTAEERESDGPSPEAVKFTVITNSRWDRKDDFGGTTFHVKPLANALGSSCWGAVRSNAWELLDK